MTIPLHEQMARWAAAEGRPLNSFEQMKTARPFKFNTRTRLWSRLLKPVLAGSPFGFVEMDLSFDIRTKTHLLNISVHTRASGIHDKFFSALPDEQKRILVEQSGDEQWVLWALFHDIWAGIDDNRLHYLTGRMAPNPVPLAMVLKPEATHGERES